MRTALGRCTRVPQRNSQRNSRLRHKAFELELAGHDLVEFDFDVFGLGLAVAAELAALHGAVLAVEDTPGGGATFTLTFLGKKARKNPKP